MNVFETGPDKTQQWLEKTPQMHVLSLLWLKYRQLEISWMSGGGNFSLLEFHVLFKFGELGHANSQLVKMFDG